MVATTMNRPIKSPIDGPSSRRIARAAETLGIGIDAQPERLRNQLLETLEAREFWPRVEEREAILVLAAIARGTAVDEVPDSESLKIRERELHARVRNLADGLFGLDPTERRGQFDQLVEESQDHLLVLARLEGLRPGLDITLPEYDESKTAADLARRLGKLFELRRAGEGTQFSQLLYATWQVFKSGHVVIRQVRLEWPKLAALEHRTLELLETNAQPARAPSADVRSTVTELSSKSSWATVRGLVVLVSVVIVLKVMVNPRLSPPEPPPTVPVDWQQKALEEFELYRQPSKREQQQEIEDIMEQLKAMDPELRKKLDVPEGLIPELDELRRDRGPSPPSTPDDSATVNGPAEPSPPRPEDQP